MAFISPKADARRLFAQRQATGYYRADGTVAPSKPAGIPSDDTAELDEKDPEDLTDEESDKELEEAKQQWQGLVRAECRNSGCDHGRATTRVAKRNPALRERMVALANRPRQSSRARSRR